MLGLVIALIAAVVTTVYLNVGVVWSRRQLPRWWSEERARRARIASVHIRERITEGIIRRAVKGQFLKGVLFWPFMMFASAMRSTIDAIIDEADPDRHRREREGREEHIRQMEIELGYAEPSRTIDPTEYGLGDRSIGRKFRAAVREWKKDH